MDPSTYINVKNYSGLTNNYSYRIQMQRQIQKAKKHQPNSSLSKLIDLGEFGARDKIHKDNVIKNIAANFKQHRANLRQGVVVSNRVTMTPRTP